MDELNDQLKLLADRLAPIVGIDPREAKALSQIEREIRAIADQVGVAKMGRWFPILGTPFAIKRSMLNEAQAQRNHGQTLDRLAERGGLSPNEAWANTDMCQIRRNQTLREAFEGLLAASTAPAARPTAPSQVPAGGAESRGFPINQADEE